jgi:hypothetical protein
MVVGRDHAMTSQQAPIMWIETPTGARSMHPITLGSQVIGRSSTADVSIASDKVSRRHAELHWDGDRLRIRDLDSRNGTAVNGEPVVDWVELRDGDVILFASIRGVIEVGGPAPPSRPARQPQPTTMSESPTGPHRSPTRLSHVPIFISHSSEDKIAARTIATYLRRADWTVWIDEAGIAGGKDWRQELVRALEQAWVVVLLVSLDSMRSKWVTREIQAADRLGKQIIPVVVDEAPYPDALRMILVGVQQIRMDQLGDEDQRGQQLAQLDHALILAARQAVKTPPGKTLILIGNVIRVIGGIGLLVGFALFAYLGFGAVEGNGFPSVGGGSSPSPFIGFGVFVIFMIVAAIGEAMRRAGMRKGI